MKRMLGLTLGVLVGLTIQMRAADPLTDALQKGLVEEEANQNLDAAIKAYQDVLARAEEQRRVAATALFRLAECYRKQGKTNEATTEYRRLLRDYAEQSTLVNLSRQNLTGLGAAPAASTTAAQLDDALATDEEQHEIQRIRALIKNSPDLINTPNRSYGGIRGTLLHEAANKGHLLVAEYLLANGSDLHARDALQATPLYQAAGNGHKRMVELLLAKGAQPSPPEAQQPLHAAVERGFKAVVEVLLAHKVDVNVEHPKEKRQGYSPSQHEGMTALHIAIKQRNLEMAELLLSAGAELNVTYEKPRAPNPLLTLSSFDGTPLHFAVQSRNPAAVKMLLGRGADANAWSSAGLTPLHYVPNREAQAESALEIAEMLFAAAAKVNTPGNEDGELPGWTPLHIAVYNKLPHILRLLLQKGADPNLLLSQSGNERTALNMAVSGGVPEVVELLLKHKADVNARDHNGNTPLVRAMREGNQQITHLLLAHKVDISTTDPQGNTALALAVYANNMDMAELLLSKGANPNDTNAIGFPLTHVALGAQPPGSPGRALPPRTRARPAPSSRASGALPPPGTSQTEPNQGKTMIELLLKYKADPNQRDRVREKESETALHLVARNGDESAVELLLKYKADPNARTDSGVTPLHWAAQSDNAPIIDMLLAHKANPNAADDKGETPLHRIAAGGATNTIAKLVQSGADLNACARNGDTPLRKMILTRNINMPQEFAAVEFLLKLGSSVVKKCDGYQSPFQHALSQKNSALINLFRKHHPTKLSSIRLDGGVRESFWFWEADQPATLSQAIAAVGLHERADPTQITLWRYSESAGVKKRRVYNLEVIRQTLQRGGADDVRLLDGDEIFVPMAN